MWGTPYGISIATWCSEAICKGAWYEDRLRWKLSRKVGPCGAHERRCCRVDLEFESWLRFHAMATWDLTVGTYFVFLGVVMSEKPFMLDLRPLMVTLPRPSLLKTTSHVGFDCRLSGKISHC
jgi:hypothetical protein